MKPHGREEVREALLEAGARLFAERGIAAVSVRDLATTAGVNHGLLHRHFGSKDELLTLVMDRLVGRLQRSLGPTAPDERLRDLLPRVFSATRSQRAYWQILLRAMLEGRDPADLQGGFPVVRRILAAAERSPRLPGGLSPESFTAYAVALGLGMVVFEPFVRAALGFEASRWRRLQRGLAQVAGVLAGG